MLYTLFSLPPDGLAVAIQEDILKESKICKKELLTFDTYISEKLRQNPIVSSIVWNYLLIILHLNTQTKNLKIQNTGYTKYSQFFPFKLKKGTDTRN